MAGRKTWCEVSVDMVAVAVGEGVDGGEVQARRSVEGRYLRWKSQVYDDSVCSSAARGH